MAYQVMALGNTHLLASTAVSGILAPNLFLWLKKGCYSQEEISQLGTGATTFHATLVADSGTDSRLSVSP